MTSPNDKSWRILKEYANGVMDQRGRFYPFVTEYLTTTAEEISAKPNVRFYIKGISGQGASTGIKGATSLVIDATWIRGAEDTVFILGLPQMTQATDFSNESLYEHIGILCQVNTRIVLSTMSFTLGRAVVTYAEVNDE